MKKRVLPMFLSTCSLKAPIREGVGEIASEVEGAGGHINAYTSNDITVYHLALAGRYFDTGLDIISDAIQSSAFDPGELEKELEMDIKGTKLVLAFHIPVIDNPDIHSSDVLPYILGHGKTSRFYKRLIWIRNRSCAAYPLIRLSENSSIPKAYYSTRPLIVSRVQFSS